MAKNLILALLLFPLFAFAQWEMDFDEDFASASADKYLVSWYRLEGDSKDYGALSLNGVETAITYQADSTRNKTVAKFAEATQSKIIANSHPMYSNFTVSVWLKRSAITDQSYIWSMDTPGLQTEYNAVLVANATAVHIYNKVTDSNLPGNNVAAFTNWTHVAVSYSGTNVLFYANGSSAGSQRFSVQPDTTTGIMNIGARQGAYSAGAWFDGLMSDFRMYNRVLSTNDINRLYNGINPAHD